MLFYFVIADLCTVCFLLHFLLSAVGRRQRCQRRCGGAAISCQSSTASRRRCGTEEEEEACCEKAARCEKEVCSEKEGCRPANRLCNSIKGGAICVF